MADTPDSGIAAFRDWPPPSEADVLIRDIVAAAGVSRRGEAPAEMRTRLVALLRIVQTFVESRTDEVIHQGPEQDVVVRSASAELLRRLINSLEDLKHGVRDPLLERSPSHGRPRLRADERERMLSALAAFSALREQGVASRPERIRRIAKAMGVDPQTVRSWVNNARSRNR
ncbi:hypothetical protein [Azospirillum sp. ST 5-10]|uniref:hypothetical protein n=1 Tax=unclassified Azospirillum TaxID=2630922 RepID=UPI003F4A1D83